ncbi:MAG TPA: hypothetical protein VGY56_20380, partial [Verrucomicrobiae bacterium]|nr:hypothetical protein [Verrucomicrobiae bacterium]
TIEETIGKRIVPGDDWHFDIQHIGAQTRWLRRVVTNETIVVAYLEADTKSWPAWRRSHSNSDRRILEILNEVCGIFASNQLEVVLASHSGGGSLIFGYLNAVDEIPARVRRIAFLDSDYAYESTLHAKKLINWLAASDANHLCVIAYQDYLGLYNGKPFVSEADGTWGRSRAMLEDLGFAPGPPMGRSGDSLSPEGESFPIIGQRGPHASATERSPSPRPSPPGKGELLSDGLATTNDSVGLLRRSMGIQFASETNSGLEIYSSIDYRLRHGRGSVTNSTTDRQIEFLMKENPDHKILHTVQVERNGFIQALLSGTPLEGRGYAYLGERAYDN